MASSEYINDQRREYSLYILQHRAIPAVTDGLKPAARRVLWTARDGKKYKSATLAGATMPLHPHASPESAVNTLAATYGNNIPLLHGLSGFGTLLDPTAFGASRYTSVKLSQFAKDVLFRDIEIIPMIENYDSTLLEPEHFLPLVPLVLVNPSEGIAIGFASKILPRDLSDIIEAQIDVLKGKKLKTEPNPKFNPINAVGIPNDTKWEFTGDLEKISQTKIRITRLPYTAQHEKYKDFLNKLKEKDEIVDYDDSSRDYISFEVKLKKEDKDLTKEELIKKLNLNATFSENLNVIDFDGQKVLSTNFCELVSMFTEWRLGWYKVRFERLKRLVEEEIQRYRDVITAINKNVGAASRKIKSRSELKIFLEEIGIVNLDYIADLPVYRFTEEEQKKVKEKLAEALVRLKEFDTYLKSEADRRKLYISELKEIQKKYEKGQYVDKSDD